jgi:hypothetical protein
MSREIMQQAFDALTNHRQQTTFQFCETNAAIKALEAELAKPEQSYDHASDAQSILHDVNADLIQDAKPEELKLSLVDIGVDVTPKGTHVVACYNRPDAVQEMFYSQFHPLAKPEMPAKIFGPNLEQILNAAGFYRREWVGLTDEEIKEVLDLNVAPWSLSGVALQHVMDDARALEAKLKEKNNAV